MSRQPPATLTEIPSWATTGLAEAMRLACLLFAEGLNGWRQWTVNDQVWRVDVATDYVDISTDVGRAVIQGRTGVTAAVNNWGERWEFIADEKREWHVMSWSGPETGTP